MDVNANMLLYCLIFCRKCFASLSPFGSSNLFKYGQIRISPFKNPPKFLARLLDNKDPMSRHFLQKIRQYNSLFSFTSMGANIMKDINKGDGPYIFRINGQIHHRIGSLLPEPNKSPKFAELYIFDTKK